MIAPHACNANILSCDTLFDKAAFFQNANTGHIFRQRCRLQPMQTLVVKRIGHGKIKRFGHITLARIGFIEPIAKRRHLPSTPHHIANGDGADDGIFALNLGAATRADKKHKGTVLPPIGIILRQTFFITSYGQGFDRWLRAKGRMEMDVAQAQIYPRRRICRDGFSQIESFSVNLFDKRPVFDRIAKRKHPIQPPVTLYKQYII